MFLNCWYLWTDDVNVIYETIFKETVSWKVDQLVPDRKLTCLCFFVCVRACFVKVKKLLFSYLENSLAAFRVLAMGVNFTPSFSPSFASSFAPSLLLDISCIHWPSRWIASRLHDILHVSCETISSHAECFVFYWQCFSFVLCISESTQHHDHRNNLHEKINFPNVSTIYTGKN